MMVTAMEMMAMTSSGSDYGGYPVDWEGNPDDDDNVKTVLKVDESDSDWENWWYYCETA